MSFDLFLEKQLQDFVTVYKTLFKKTFGVTIILSFLCLLFILALHLYGGPEVAPGKSLSSYIWYRFSVSAGYQFVDMSKSILLFVISFFSIALSRKVIRDGENLNVQFGSFFDEMKPGDFGFLFLALVGCLVIDYLLCQVDTYVYTSMSNKAFSPWIFSQTHFLRIYLPLLLFSYVNKLALTKNKSFFTLKKCLFLLTALWLFNEMAYEFALFVRGHIFALVMAPFPAGTLFFVESMLELPLIAVLFLGYHSAITNAALIPKTTTEFDEFLVTGQTPV